MSRQDQQPTDAHPDCIKRWLTGNDRLADMFTDIYDLIIICRRSSSHCELFRQMSIAYAKWWFASLHFGNTHEPCNKLTASHANTRHFGYNKKLCYGRGTRDALVSIGTRVPGLSCSIICLILRIAVFIQYYGVWQTHTQTDGRTHDDGIYRA